MIRAAYRSGSYGDCLGVARADQRTTSQTLYSPNTKHRGKMFCGAVALTTPMELANEIAMTRITHPTPLNRRILTNRIPIALSPIAYIVYSNAICLTFA